MPQRVSRRAGKAWDRLKQWYGTRLAESYGDLPPEDWCNLFDRTDDERLDAALSAVRHQTPVHPPTLGQLEASIPKPQDFSGPSIPQRLCSLMLSTHGAHMCRHQFARTWNYFGPEKEPPRGVQCPPCEPCLRPSFRVLLEDDITPGIAA